MYVCKGDVLVCGIERRGGDAPRSRSSARQGGETVSEGKAGAGRQTSNPAMIKISEHPDRPNTKGGRQEGQEEGRKEYEGEGRKSTEHELARRGWWRNQGCVAAHSNCEKHDTKEAVRYETNGRPG